jgi:hypothetical protein
MDDEIDIDEYSARGTLEMRSPRPLLRAQRVLQIALGLFWILDAALQFQPFMFSKNFVPKYVTANASGQPAVIHWAITNVGHFLAPHPAVWNSLFALTQLAIGVGLLLRRTVRPALAISFLYALGVWVFGEGLGMVLTGSASALTGAPGSVLIYALIGLMAWPRTATGQCEPGQRRGIASSAAAQGIGGAFTPLAVWSGFWTLAAVLFLLPNNRTQSSIASAISGMAPGNPGWYSHFLERTGDHFASVGTQTAWVLAIVSLVIGFGPLTARRPQVFLAAGGVLAALLWITGQGFLGGVLTGHGTDPNTAPLIVLLAFAMMPGAGIEESASRPPLVSFVRRNPVVATIGFFSVALALVVSAAYPAPAQETAGTAMSGMVGMAGGSASSEPTLTTASCTAGNSGTARSGLDLNNTPYMIMSGNAGMNMNGADASAAAGLNTTKASWNYTGPALPIALAHELLAQGKNGPDDIHMAETGCAAEPTFSQEINSTQFVQATSQAVARYDNLSTAVAAGYVAVSPVAYPVVYYVNPSIEAANAVAKRTLSAAHIDGLIYARIPSGQMVLAAALYALPPTVHKAPMPFGALVQWHQRTAVCGPLNGSATTLDLTGTPPCGTGTVQAPTPYMTMVWQVPVAGGPTAIQPPDIQIVEAAVMQATT